METPSGVYDQIPRLIESGTPFAVVVVTSARGSTPQDAGAKMIVTAAGLHAGTVGGGKIETRAVGHAQAMLADGAATATVEWNLRKDVGMTCGGVMTLFFEVHRGSEWTIAIFGAGHVAQALVPVLAPLSCQILCHDPRPEWLARLPRLPNVHAIEMAVMEDAVADLPDGAYVLLMTQGHSTDFPILRRILESRSFPYVGVIGSRSKRAALETELRAAGVPAEKFPAFECPLGLPIGTNHPQEIAISIAAGILEARDQARAGDQSTR